MGTLKMKLGRSPDYEPIDYARAAVWSWRCVQETDSGQSDVIRLAIEPTALPVSALVQLGNWPLDAGYRTAAGYYAPLLGNMELKCFWYRDGFNYGLVGHQDGMLDAVRIQLAALCRVYQQFIQPPKVIEA